jgi:hypothetical protein
MQQTRFAPKPTRADSKESALFFASLNRRIFPAQLALAPSPQITEPHPTCFATITMSANSRPRAPKVNVVVAQWRPPNSFPNAKSWVPHSSQSHRDEWGMLPPILKSQEPKGHGFSRAVKAPTQTWALAPEGLSQRQTPGAACLQLRYLLPWAIQTYKGRVSYDGGAFLGSRRTGTRW